MKVVSTSTYDANVTTVERSLGYAALIKPEIMVHVSNLFEKQFSSFSSYLARRGFIKKDLFPDFDSENFRVIGNRKFMWPQKGYPFRKGKIVDTPYSPQGFTKLGIDNSIIIMPLDTNFFSPNDVLELKDQRTKVFLMNEYPEEGSSPNVWLYKAKLVTSEDGSYIPSHLLEIGSEVGFAYTMFPELSETGYEKNTYPEWNVEYMTIQRMMFSISGTAANTVLWLDHKGERLWIYQQHYAMLERWYYAREMQLIHGKATIDSNDRVYMKDMKSREVIAGNGILEQGDPSLKIQYQKMTKRFIEKLMQNMQLLSTNPQDMVELLYIGGQQSIWELQQLMTDVFKFNPQPLFIKQGDIRGVDATFNFVQMGGVKLVWAWNPMYDAPWRPENKDSFGNNKNSRRGMFCGLNGTIGQTPNVELCTLGASSNDRSFVQKMIPGMVSFNGKNVLNGSSNKFEVSSSSIDGLQVQVLSESGVKMENRFGVAEIYVP